MKRLLFIFSSLCFAFSFLHAHPPPFTADELDDFYEDYLSEQKETLISTGLIRPSPQAAVASGQPQTLPPVPLAGLMPVVIVNNSGVEADKLFVVVYGPKTAADVNVNFIQFNERGIGSYVPVSASNSSKQFSFLLSSLPFSTTNATKTSKSYLMYVPYINSGRIYISTGNPLYLLTTTAAPFTVTAPQENNFRDPNYETFYENFECTFKTFPPGNPQAINWTATVNTTSVDFFSGPIEVEYFSYPTAQPLEKVSKNNKNGGPTGFNKTKTTLFTNYEATFMANGGANLALWNRLFIPFYENPYDASSTILTHLRVISANSGFFAVLNPTFFNTKMSFPADYTSTATADDFLTAFYAKWALGANTLTIDTDETVVINKVPVEVIYTSSPTSTATNFIVLGSPTSSLYDDNIQIAKTPLITNCAPFFTGTLFPTTPAAPDAYGLRFEDYLSAAFTIGFLPDKAAGVTMNSGYFVTQGFNEFFKAANSGVAGGPWYNLYAKALHNEAEDHRCYASPYSDAIGLGSAITPSNLTPASLGPYLVATLHDVTPLPDPFNDMNSYDVTMTFPLGPSYSLNYRQGSSGPWIPVTSGVVITPKLFSNKTNPLQIQYTNPTGGTLIFTVYLKYQFLQPEDLFQAKHNAVTSATTFVPMTPPTNPTAFTLNVTGG